MRVRENTGPRSMVSPATNLDIDPDAASKVPLFSGLSAVSGRQSGHRVRIPTKPLSWGAETCGMQPPSRHFSRQDGERNAPVRRNLGDSAVYPAILRDSPPPGIAVFRNKPHNPGTRTGEVLIVNARQVFEKRDPSRAERDRLPKAIRRANVGTFVNSFVPEAGSRSIEEIIAKLDAIKAEAEETDKALPEILGKIGT